MLASRNSRWFESGGIRHPQNKKVGDCPLFAKLAPGSIREPRRKIKLGAPRVMSSWVCNKGEGAQVRRSRLQRLAHPCLRDTPARCAALGGEVHKGNQASGSYQGRRAGTGPVDHGLWLGRGHAARATDLSFVSSSTRSTSSARPQVIPLRFPTRRRCLTSSWPEFAWSELEDSALSSQEEEVPGSLSLPCSASRGFLCRQS